MNQNQPSPQSRMVIPFRIVAVVVAMVLSTWLFGQSNPTQIELHTITNIPVSFTAQSASQVGVNNVSHGTASIQSNGSGIFEITFTPAQDWTGTTHFTLVYYKSIPQPPFIDDQFTEVTVNVGDAIITPKNDFVEITSAGTYTIDPLVNDTSTAPGLHLNQIAYVQSGSASVVDSNTVSYTTPAVAKDLDYLVYTASDIVGVHAYATVYFASEASTYNAQDTLYYIIGNTESQIIKLPIKGYTTSSVPLAGDISDRLGGMVWEYTSDTNGTAQDTLVFTNANGSTYTVIITINDYSSLKLVMDDEVYTPKETSITFDAFANDNINGNVILDSYSSALVHDSAGVFSYMPPVNFQGKKKFSYTIDNGFGLHEAFIEINVGDQFPKWDTPYSFTTTQDKSVLIHYDVETEGYTLQVSGSPSHGYAFAYDVNTLTTVECNDIISKAYVIYTPAAGYVGVDSFDVTFCAANGNCNTYTLTVEVDDLVSNVCKCLTKDCVWSGDANNDGRINVRDLLPVARYVGQAGPARSDIDYGMWAPQFADDWMTAQPNGSNVKFVDSNGDGTVTAEDLVAIADNYNAVHTLVPTDILAFKQFPLYLVPRQTQVSNGDLLVLDIHLGTPNKPVENLQGLAFGFNINAGFVDSASMEVHFDDASWFAGNGATMQMFYSPNDGRAEAAFGKANGFNANGYGIIGQLSFIVEEEAEGFKTDGQATTRQIKIQTDNIEIEDPRGNRFALEPSQTNVTLLLRPSADQISDENLKVYPNPVNDQLTVFVEEQAKIEQLILYNAFGQFAGKYEGEGSSFQRLSLGSLTSGFYILSVQTDKGLVSTRLVVQ